MFRLTRPTSPSLDSVPNTNDSTGTCRQQALTRSRQKLAYHHPNVKLPPRLEDKPKEEQIRRCCDRFKTYPSTVDTLTRALSTIMTHPSEGKYRHIDQTNHGYQRSLAKVPGAEQLLLVLGFSPAGTQTLFLSRVDRELLSLALSILEQTKETHEYRQAKKEQLFAKEMTMQLRTAPTRVEQGKRKDFLSTLPREPSPGQSAVMMIQVGDDNSTTLTRRFDGDDTLEDVLHWLAGTGGTDFLDKLFTSRQWSLVDVNRQGHVPIDCKVNQNKTLQYLGFWPSGRLAVRPSSPDWVQGAVAHMEMGPSRGLGSAPSETLQYD